MRGVACLGDDGGVASRVGVVVSIDREIERPIRIHLNGIPPSLLRGESMTSSLAAELSSW